MTFENEATYARAAAAGSEAEFHRRFEDALEEVEGELGETHPLFIDGKPVACSTTFEDRSPSNTDRVVGVFQKGGAPEAGAAVRAAVRAFPAWADLDWRERVRILRAAGDVLSRRKYRLAALMCHENGKNRLEAMADVDEAIDFLRWYPGEVERNDGFDQELEGVSPDERARSVLRPYGAWAVIAPFNFPLAIACGMSAGALVTGNTVVLKPATDTPLMSLLLYEALEEAGLPGGVLNFLTGPGREVGEALVSHPEVAGLVFTGSREVGLSSFRTLTQGFPRPVITELGGKNPVIVTDHADLDKAVPGVGRGAFGFGGQKCSATSRVYLHEAIQEEFAARLVAWTEELSIGDPAAQDTDLGPLINRRAYESFQSYARLAAKDGTIRTGGSVRTTGDLAKGYFVDPTVVSGLPTTHRLFREELFVPLVALASVPSLEEGLRHANASEYGLCAGIFTENPEERETFFREVRAGVTYCNRAQGATTGAIVGSQPFGGWGESGISGKGAGGRHYLQQFLREQSQTYYV